MSIPGVPMLMLTVGEILKGASESPLDDRSAVSTWVASPPEFALSYTLPSKGWSLEIRTLDRRRRRSLYLMQKMNDSVRCLATGRGSLAERVSVCHLCIMQAQPVKEIDDLTMFDKDERTLIKQRFVDLLAALDEAFQHGAPPVPEEHAARFAEEILTLNHVLGLEYEV